MKIGNQSAIQNRLLRALPRAEYLRIETKLQQVKLAFNDVLYEPGDAIKHVYFPDDSLVSLLTLVDDRSALEVGMVGRERMVGIPLALGIDASPVRALVQGEGTAMRMTAAHFRKEFRHSLHLQNQVHLYTGALMSQVAQSAACNRFHLVEARLARWLLMTRDRVGSNDLHMTHEFLGHMLGVRRVGVTKAAHALKKRGLIEYSRGNIVILNGRALEAVSCSCYQMDKNRYGQRERKK